MSIEFKTFNSARDGLRNFSYIVCAFYTEGYADEVINLKDSLDQLNIPYHIQFYKSRGYWEANTLIKPEFLCDCLEKFSDRDILYLDADCVVRSSLSLFECFDADIGVFVSPKNKGYSHRFLTGTIYLKNNLGVRAFLQSWIAAQKNYVLSVDQDSFEVAIDAHPKLSVLPLPASYVKIFDKGEEVPVIEHFQASRKRTKLKRTIRRIFRVGVVLCIVALLVWAFR